SAAARGHPLPGASGSGTAPRSTRSALVATRVRNQREVAGALHRAAELALEPGRHLGGALRQDLALLRQEAGQRAHVLVVEQRDRGPFHAASASPATLELGGRLAVVLLLVPEIGRASCRGRSGS